jgi:hypothetical protein
MENVDKIHRQLAMKPFRPFWVYTTAGSQIRVDRPEWFWEVPDSHGEVAIFGHQGYALLNYRDVSSLVIVEVPPPPPTNGEVTQ